MIETLPPPVAVVQSVRKETYIAIIDEAIGLLQAESIENYEYDPESRAVQSSTALVADPDA